MPAGIEPSDGAHHVARQRPDAVAPRGLRQQTVLHRAKQHAGHPTVGVERLVGPAAAARRMVQVHVGQQTLESVLEPARQGRPLLGAACPIIQSGVWAPTTDTRCSSCNALRRTAAGWRWNLGKPHRQRSVLAGPDPCRARRRYGRDRQRDALERHAGQKHCSEAFLRWKSPWMTPSSASNCETMRSKYRVSEYS